MDIYQIPALRDEVPSMGADATFGGGVHDYSI